jgi:mRNA-degrading endonuclease RelE of RelBE toxin-antitoxin system
MVHTIQLTPSAASELRAIRAYDRRRIVNEMERQLIHQPTVETRNRKCLAGSARSVIATVWELRVGDYRVFYDVDSDAKTVHVRAVRRKTPNRTTEEIL